MIAALLLCLSVQAQAGPDSAAVDAAFAEGRFADAARLAVEASKTGREDEAALLFREGNALHRLGRHAEAALAFRRAALRRPRDERIAFNLRWTERALRLPPEASTSSSEALPFTAAELLAASLASTLVGAAFFFGASKSRRMRRAAAVAAAIALSTGLIAVPRLQGVGPERGVVLTSVPLRTAPHGESAAPRTLRPGEAVRVLARSDRYARVAARRGEGWIATSSLGLVD